jgi:hypothetical protein
MKNITLWMLALGSVFTFKELGAKGRDVSTWNL